MCLVEDCQRHKMLLRRCHFSYGGHITRHIRGLLQGLQYHNWKAYLPKLCGGLMSVVLPPLHIGVLYLFWHQFARHVDKRHCTCSCWDTVFKGSYESGVASYKHVYFNATRNTLKMWILTVVALLTFYETVRHIITLIMAQQLRISMFLLFISVVFSHYYSWWAYVNYWNDDFYYQWNHQLFFTVSELISTAVVVHLANCTNMVTTRKVVVIVGIAIIHVMGSGWDQFIRNVIKKAGYAHQITRDVGLMMPDILHIVIPLFELGIASMKSSTRATCSEIKRDAFLFLIILIMGLIMCFWF